jgi:RND family efflux transporter MFP subunit
MRRLTGAIVIGVLLSAGACSAPAVEELETSTAVPVSVEAARVETLQGVIAVTGMVVPAPGAEWTIVAPQPGRIAELPKAEGDRVAEGEVLVRFDIPSLPAELAGRRADVAQAQARLDTAKAAVARVTGLFEKGVAARKDVELATQEQAQADAALGQAQSAVDAAVTLADRAIVKARFAGVVTHRWHNPGDLVDASASDPILRVINPNELQIVAAVPVADLPRVIPGHAARVIDPAGDADINARVLIRPAQVDPSSATADVRLAFTSPHELAAGTAVQVEITGRERPHVVVVPSVAVVRDGEETYVMIAGADNKARKQPVATGLSARNLTEIASGVKTGDLVIVRGQEGLPDGAAITVMK